MGAWEQLDTEISLELDVSNLDSIIDLCDEEFTEDIRISLEEIKKGIEDGSKEGIHEIAVSNRTIQQQLITDLSEHPYASGRLGSSITEEQQDEYTWLVGTTITHFYPLTVEYGRGEIRPVHAKVLTFYSLSGEMVFTKYVKPAKPKPFVAPAYEKTLDMSEELMLQCIERNI